MSLTLKIFLLVRASQQEPADPLIIRYALDIVRKKDELDMKQLDSVLSLWDNVARYNEVYLAYILFFYVELRSARERIRSSIVNFLISYVKKFKPKIRNDSQGKKRHHLTTYFLACGFKITQTVEGISVLTRETEDYLDNFLKVLVDHAEAEQDMHGMCTTEEGCHILQETNGSCLPSFLCKVNMVKLPQTKMLYILKKRIMELLHS